MIKIIDAKFKKDLVQYQDAVLELPHIIGEQKLKINATLRSVISELDNESGMEISNG